MSEEIEEKRNILRSIYELDCGNLDVPGLWRNPEIKFKLDKDPISISRVTNNMTIINNFLSEFDIEDLLEFFDSAPNKEPVSVQGTKPTGNIGSHRATVWSPELAMMLSEKLFTWNHTVNCNNTSRTDVQRGNWRSVGLTPMLRFMEYQDGGEHFPHYDRGYSYSSNLHTLQSIVIYLTTSNYGATRNIADGQNNMNQTQRTNDDWTRRPENHEVSYSSYPIAGRAFTFNHRMCHDVAPHVGEERRVIIRGDILFERVDTIGF